MVKYFFDKEIVIGFVKNSLNFFRLCGNTIDSISVWVIGGGEIPANTRHRPNVEPMLGQRRRRWANIGSPLGRCLLGWALYVQIM